MSFQSRLGCWWVRLRIKRKPPTEGELIEFTRKRFRPPAWLIGLQSLGAKIERVNGPVKGEWVLPSEVSDEQSLIYYLHGGGYISGSARTNRPLTIPLARRSKRRLFALDYRLAPEHRFPAAVEDAVAGYRWLIAQGIDPSRMTVAGDSAGGGLALALVMRLRDMGERLPASVVCMSPWTDMIGDSKSIVANSERDPFFCTDDVERYARVYLGDQSRKDPLASPLHGDFSGLPPLLLHVGESEMLLDDGRGVHEKMLATGGSSELRIFPEVPHAWQFGWPLVPEARASLQEIVQFIRRH
jgi:epsilon-lactone hydrolase